MKWNAWISLKILCLLYLFWSIFAITITINVNEYITALVRGLIMIVITIIMINIISIVILLKKISLNHELVDALSRVVRLVSISPGACEGNISGWPISLSTGSRNSLTLMSFWTFLFLSEKVASKSGRILIFYVFD